MADPQDQFDLGGRLGGEGCEPSAPEHRQGAGDARPWISVWFQCCHTYARIYRNAAGTRYDGRCPRCGARVGATVGPGGTSQRFFRTR